MYLQAYDCPNCGAAVPFPSAIAVFAVCAHCRSNVVRGDAAGMVENLGQQAQLPPDLSPLQIGTAGVYAGCRFTLTGRVRLGYNQGSWNEWLAEFEDGRWGWIAEAQGFYYASFEVPAPSDLSTAGALPLGTACRMGDVEYRVRDVKSTEVLGSEGALPFVAVPGRSAVSVDLGAPDRGFANLEFSPEGVRAFLGQIRTFEELGFSNLRPLPGWTTDQVDKEAVGSTALGCPACGGTVELTAAGQSMTALCRHCGSLLDTSHPQLQLIEHSIAKEPALTIPLGQRGRFEGVDFACIGYVRREDDEGESRKEYLLFNPFAGFRWLVTYEGHWSWVTVLPGEPERVDTSPIYQGQPYRLFASGVATVTEVWGEFYWSVRLGEKTSVSDFIAPPFVLSRELYAELGEATWSHGQYLEPSVVYSAFGLDSEPRSRNSIYLNQPNPHREKGRTLRWLLPVFAILWLVLSLITAGTRANERAFEHTFRIDLSGTNRTLVTPAFRIGGDRPQVLRIDLHAPVDQSWVAFDLDLINTQTKAVQEVRLNAEFWSGVDDGEPWSEGSRDVSELVPAVEPGEYQLVMDADGSPQLSLAQFHLEVTRDVMVWSNLVLGLVGLLAYPLYRWLREHTFERGRWSVSSHSPYTQFSSSEDEDADSDED